MTYPSRIDSFDLQAHIIYSVEKAKSKY